MFLLAGFAVGYVLGARAGTDGLQELVKAWQTIYKSEEVQAAVESARSLAGSLARQAFDQGVGAVSGEVKDVLDRRLRRAA